MTQLPFEGMDHHGAHETHFGYLYICLGDNAVVKIGRSATEKGMRRRIADHRKHEPSLRDVSHSFIPYVINAETALRRMLADYVESEDRVAGHEWFHLNAYTAGLIIDFMAQHGAETEKLEAEFAQAVANRASRWWGAR